MSQLISIEIKSDFITEIQLPSDIIKITHATVLPPKDSPLLQSDSDVEQDSGDDERDSDEISDASYLIECTNSASHSFILGRVDLEQTQLSLDVQLNNINGKSMKFKLINENAANQEKWTVVLSGYIVLHHSKSLIDLHTKYTELLMSDSKHANTTTTSSKQVNGNSKRPNNNNDVSIGNAARRDPLVFSEEDIDVNGLLGDDNISDSMDDGAEAENESMSDSDTEQEVQQAKPKKQKTDIISTQSQSTKQVKIDPKPHSTPATNNTQQTPKQVRPESAAASQSSKPGKAAPATPQIVKLKGGLEYKINKPGQPGKQVSQGSTVSIRYRGQLLNGTVFDTNLPRGAPLRFTVGGGEVIKGFEQGVLGMNINEVRTVSIPAHLGYGKRGAGPEIPPNSTLIFEIHLVKTT